MIRYSVYLEESNLESFRLGYCPREDYAVAFICPFAVVSGASGKLYNGLRGFEGEYKNIATNYGLYQLDKQLEKTGPLIYSFRDVPFMEPYWITESPDTVSYVSKHTRFDFRVDGYDWYDADGRWELRTKRIGDVCTFWVPEQEGYPHPQMLRSHAAKATGTINGDPVEGLFMLDFIYSRPGLTFFEVPMCTKLHNLWLNWLVEYTDGSYEGGYTWRGRPGTGFAATHHIVDGVSYARTDSKIVTTYTEKRGGVQKNHVQLGDEVTFELEQYGCCDWPIHTCGTVSSTSRGKKIAKSWNYTEFFPQNAAQLMQFQKAYTEFIGQPPKMGSIYSLGKARIENDYIVFPKGLEMKDLR